MTGASTPVGTVTARIAATSPADAKEGTTPAASGQDLPQPEPDRVDPVAVEEAVQRLNEFVTDSRRSLEFRVDDGSGRTIITVVNSNTGEVVRQIPAEEVLALARNLRQSGAALLNTLA